MKARLDIEKAKAAMAPSLGHWRDLKTIGKVAERHEIVRRIGGGQHEGRSGLLVLTDRQLMFVSERRVCWAVSLGRVEHASCAIGDMFGIVTVRTPDSILDVRFVDSRDALALVTELGGECRRQPIGVAIAC